MRSVAARQQCLSIRPLTLLLGPESYALTGVIGARKMTFALFSISSARRGFEHHVAANLSTVASAVYEATTGYMGWEMHCHNCENGAS